MIENELRIGAYACNCNQLQFLRDGSSLLLLVCGDQENYVSLILRASKDFTSLTDVFFADTWILSMHFCEQRRRLFASTAGGRLIEILDRTYAILLEDLPFISGFRSIGRDRLFAFGWHGVILELRDNWSRLGLGIKARLFDLRAHNERIYVCGDRGLLAEIETGQARPIDLQTNIRLRRMQSLSDRLRVFSQAPVYFDVTHGQVNAIDIDHAPAWDVLSIAGRTLLACGLDGLMEMTKGGLVRLGDFSSFKLGVYDDTVAILAESQCHLMRNGVFTTVNFEQTFRRMLERYGHFDGA
jgi:hypothetical protein